MIFVDNILSWARANGYAAEYGSPEQINEVLYRVDVAASAASTFIYMYLITDGETRDGRDRANVAIYFARLMPFDFMGEALLPVQEELKNIGKEYLRSVRAGNVCTYSGPMWSYGYGEFADNLAWVCLRVTLEASAADCTPLMIPDNE